MSELRRLTLVFFLNILYTGTNIIYELRGGHGRDRMVVGLTTIYAISTFHHCCGEFESRSGWGVQHYVIKFVSDLRQVSDKLYHIMLYTSPWSRFELTTSMVIGTNCIGSCKSKYHTIWYFLFHLIIKNSIIKIAVNFRIFRIAPLDFKGCSCTLSTIVFPCDNDATHI